MLSIKTFGNALARLAFPAGPEAGGQAGGAAASGVADSNRMARQFGGVHGLTPGRWAAMLGRRPTILKLSADDRQ
jgi:hypothetical protein